MQYLRRIRQGFRLRVGLRWQIALLGTCGVLVVGAIYLIGLRLQADLQREADRSTALKHQVDDAAQDFLRVYQIDTEFLLKRKEQLIAAHDTLVEGLGSKMNGIDSILADIQTDDPVHRAAAARAGINNYAVRFRNVAAAQRNVGFNENSGLEGDLRNAVHQIETKLGEFNDLQLKVLMLMMRRHEKDFLLRGDEKYGADLGKRGDEFTKVLASSTIAPDTQEVLRGLLARYRQSFNALMIGRGTLKEESDDLTQIFTGTSRILSEARTATAARFDNTQRAIATTREATTLAMVVAIVITVLCAGALSVYVGVRTTKPLAALAAAMERAAAGDHDVEVVAMARRDEIGAISRAFCVFQEGMRDNARLSAERQRVLADNQRLAAEKKEQEDRDAAELAAAAERNEAARKAAVGTILREFETNVAGIIETVSSAADELALIAERLAIGAGQTQGLANTVAKASDAACSNVQTVATATEELTISAQEIGRQVQNSSQMSGDAVQQVERTDERVATLSGAATRIGDVVKLITAIAEQTNLLALNATIEAARAGEAGRGFAVVAQEVKALATQTAKATNDISTQIADMQVATKDSVGAIKEIGVTISKVSEIASSIAAAAEEQEAATREIARNVAEAAKGTTIVARNIAEVTTHADETGTASSEMLASARSLSTEATRLRSEVGRFLEEVRTRAA